MKKVNNFNRLVFLHEPYGWFIHYQQKIIFVIILFLFQGSICKDYMAMIFCEPLAICQMLHELDEMGL